MARLARTVRALAALLFFVGIVLLPLRAAAATVPTLIAYDVAALSTTTMPVERPDTVRREVEPASNDYDRACAGCDDPWDPPVAAGAADIHAYDDTLELLERRERANQTAVLSHTVDVMNAIGTFSWRAEVSRADLRLRARSRASKRQ
ncbi:MAG TPA: hypothetical protein VGL84_04100 [Gaiellaceae bacterium]